MGKIYFTSDLHFGHSRGFLYEPRGFSCIEDHDDAIVENWNNIVTDEDTVYVLGDLMLCGQDNSYGISRWNELKGNKFIVRGNHDSAARLELYKQQPNTTLLEGYSTMIKYDKKSILLSHHPTMTDNLDRDSLDNCLWNFFGHTHSKNKFYQNIPFMVNVALDAWNCCPVEIHEIFDTAFNEVNNCLSFL